MSDENIARILKMLEEGKISASEAEKLLSALRAEPRPAPPPPPPPPPHAPGARPAPEREDQQTAGAKSFEFRWSHRRGHPLDLSNISKQFADAFKRLDPDRLIREARAGSKRWQELLRNWTRDWTLEESAPENTFNLPVASDVEERTFELPEDALVQVENPAGGITITQGPVYHLEVRKEAWAASESEATARLHEIKVDVATFARPDMPEPGISAPPARLEVRLSTPEGWRDGKAEVRLQVPAGAQLRLATVFGPISVSDVAGNVEAHSISGEVALLRLQGEVRAEAVSGNIRASHMGGPLQLNAKSGDIIAENLSRGASVNSVSGDVRITNAEGGRVEAKSVSGDVTVDRAGNVAPVDVAVESVSGDVRLEQVEGNITLKTVSGDSSALHLAASTLQCKAISGDVTLQLDAPFSGTLSCTTVSGQVRIAVPAGSNFRYTLDTQSGDITCGVEARETSSTETLRNGVVGTGAGTVSVQTLSGDIALVPRDDA